jgi:succinate dehydrogenase / fumarate reductase, cytochrome b subunit
MALKRQVGLREGFRYKGGGPMLVWALHRLSGIGIALFVGLHILASFSSQLFGWNLAKSLNVIYESPYFQIIVFFCVMFHAINGLRITILDLWPKLIEYQREAIWVEWAVFIPLYSLAVIVIIGAAAGG